MLFIEPLIQSDNYVYEINNEQAYYTTSNYNEREMPQDGGQSNENDSKQLSPSNKQDYRNENLVNNDEIDISINQQLSESSNVSCFVSPRDQANTSAPVSAVSNNFKANQSHSSAAAAAERSNSSSSIMQAVNMQKQSALLINDLKQVQSFLRESSQPAAQQQQPNPAATPVQAKSTSFPAKPVFQIPSMSNQVIIESKPPVALMSGPISTSSARASLESLNTPASKNGGVGSKTEAEKAKLESSIFNIAKNQSKRRPSLLNLIRHSSVESIDSSHNRKLSEGHTFSSSVRKLNELNPFDHLLPTTRSSEVS